MVPLVSNLWLVAFTQGIQSFLDPILQIACDCMLLDHNRGQAVVNTQHNGKSMEINVI